MGVLNQKELHFTSMRDNNKHLQQLSETVRQTNKDGEIEMWLISVCVQQKAVSVLLWQTDARQVNCYFE